MTALLVSLLLTVCPTAPLQVERLPDLNVPRLGHSVFCVGGEVVAAGGHTTGFVPTQTHTDTGDNELMERICRYMDEQQPYLSSELKVQDVADALGSNRTYISNCIKNPRGCSFTQFVNTYRVEYAQQLLSVRQPFSPTCVPTMPSVRRLTT